jgi:carbonic anhydrase
MAGANENDSIVKELIAENQEFVVKNAGELNKHIEGQNPKIAILTCADSRVIPEYIFNKNIGEIFVIRVAGNVALDPSVLTSIEYAVVHLNVPYLIILGHTHCGAVEATEKSTEENICLFNEIKDSFPLDEEDHIKANVKRQFLMIPKRSSVIETAIKNKKLTLLGAIYHLETGHVEFL